MVEGLIYADLLKKDLDKTIEHIAKKQGGTEEGSFAVGMCLAFKTMIGEQPTIEAKPIVHAHWECDSAIDPYCCSNCGKKALQDYFEEDVLSKYCPYCGAQMDEMVVEENATTTNNTQKVSVDGVKIPVISMEDVPKIMEKIK